MNARHSKVTDWGLSHVKLGSHDTILDVGCGGGRTIAKLATQASEGKIYGIDHSAQAVAVATRLNKGHVASGRVDVREASVSQLPFPDNTFDVVTAIETHFWWPDLPAGMAEILRVLNPGATLIVIAEIYRGAATKTAQFAEHHLPRSGMKLLTVTQHRDLFADAGYSDIQVIENSVRGWICVIGRKPRFGASL